MAKTKETPKNSTPKNGQKHDQKRKSVRFTPDPGTIAWVDTETNASKKAFVGEIPALVTEESYRGCGLVLTMTKKLQVGDKLQVKVGSGAPLSAEVRWRTDLDAQVIRIGVMYLE